MDTTLEDRVREVIASTGMTQDAFATRLRMTPDKLSKSLRGRRRFTAFELALAADAGSTTVEWLLTGTTPETPALAARAATIDDAAPIVALMERYAEADHQLQLLDGPRDLTALANTTTPRQRAAWATQQLASRGLTVDDTGNAKLIEAVEETFDIDVVIDRLPPDTDGAAWQTSSIRLIALTTTPYWARQRYSLAHELGHILARDAQDDLIAEQVTKVTNHSERADERAAQRFAAEFLMPAGVLREHAQGGRLSEDAFVSLVNRLRVSPTALSWRALNLNLITSEQQEDWSRLTAERCALAGGVPELIRRARVSSDQRRMPPRLVDGHLRAYGEGRTSARPLAALLGIEVAEVIDLFASEPVDQ